MSNRENQKAVEVLSAAFEQMAERARQKKWPAEVVADAAFRSAVSLYLLDNGVKRTTQSCLHLGEELMRLSDFLDGAKMSRSLFNDAAY